ncbi:uncharacterized protein LOC136034148 [Artemia franciscana]|uniref:uncharacterized protein LOC136034148 n=1 Tax=Artemia franciscana TaxID=6661 RepID=UPI0032DB435C
MACFQRILPSTFCYCSTLDTGAYIIGITGLVLSIISFLRSVAYGGQSSNVYYGSIVGAILLLIASIFLVIAVRTRRSIYCWPYMILSAIVIVTMIVNLVGSIFGGDGTTGVISIVIIGLEIYFFLVVISFYKALNGTVVVSNA